MKLTAKSNDAFFVTLTVVFWIDLFTRPIYNDLIISNLEFCQKNKNLEVFSYVLMSNHLHMIVRSNTTPLSDVLRDFKSFTSKQLYTCIKQNPQESRKEWILDLMNKAGRENSLNLKHQCWQNFNQPILISSYEQFFIKQNYIHQNPVKRGIVVNEHEYKYSSASEDSPLKTDPY